MSTTGLLLLAAAALLIYEGVKLITGSGKNTDVASAAAGSAPPAVGGTEGARSVSDAGGGNGAGGSRAGGSETPTAPTSTPGVSGGDYGIPPYGSHQAFINAFYPAAQRAQAQYGIPADVLTAIAISESNWGNTPNNASLFGIKGPGFTTSTPEVINGQWVTITDSFRTYPSVDAAIQDFVNLASSGRYAGAWQQFQQTRDPLTFLRGLVSAGYATDTSWPDKIMSIARTTVDPMVGAR